MNAMQTVRRPATLPALLRVGLWFLAIPFAVTGLWAALAPQSFYASFPGLGHAWVVVLPPYNEHLVRDVGDLYLGLAVVVTWAAVTLDRRLVQCALAACVVAGLPHLLFHLGHLNGLTAADAGAEVSTLVLTLALPVALLVALYQAAGRESAPATKQEQRPRRRERAV